MDCQRAGQHMPTSPGTASTESVPHTVTHSHTSGTSKVVCHTLVVASTPSWSIACDVFQTHLTFAGNVETHLTFACKE